MLHWTFCFLIGKPSEENDIFTVVQPDLCVICDPEKLQTVKNVPVLRI